MKSKLILLLSVAFFQINFIIAQKELLQSGPMLGYSEMKEVMLWVQTKKEATVKIQYYLKNNSSIKHWTNSINTKKEEAYSAHLLADELEPGNIYNYDLFINNKKIKFNYPTEFQTLKMWKGRTDPPEISFVAGSGTYVSEEKYNTSGKDYSDSYKIFESIASKKPDFMLWIGDNIYLKDVDLNSKTGINHRYTHTRSIKEMQALLASTHNYAIMDDHDFGADASDKSFWNKNATLDAFKLFWGNPSYGIGEIKGAITFFNWGDCDFFMLDNRYHRDPDKLIKDNKTILGKKQLQWLKNALVSSKANFKFVVMGGQFLNPAGFSEVYSNNGFSKERADIIEFINRQNIINVIFITGDRHHSEISVSGRTYRPLIYDVTCSSLTSQPAQKKDEEVNPLRIEGSLINENNFTVFNIKGGIKSRTLTITFYNRNGEEIVKY